MLLVVCGAGASHDCIEPGRRPGSDTYRPPLTRDLFTGGRATAAANAIVESRAPVRELQQSVTDADTVEQVLSRWTEESLGRVKGAPTVMRRHDVNATRWFLRRRIEEVAGWPNNIAHQTHYLHLVRRLEAWREPRGERIAYVTFNYDTLLDEALEGCLLIEAPIAEDAYVANRDTLLVKPHGSVDWWHRVDAGVDNASLQGNAMRRISIRDAAPQNVDPQIIVHRGPWTDLTGVHLPAVAMPVVDKDSFECPGSQVNALIEALSEVDRVMLIGWRAREELFLGLLRKHLRRDWRLQVVTTDAQHSKGIADYLIEAGIKGPTHVEHMGGGFSGFVEERAWSVLRSS